MRERVDVTGVVEARRRVSRGLEGRYDGMSFVGHDALESFDNARAGVNLSFVVMPSFLLPDLFSEKNLVLDLKGKTAGEAVWEIVERLRAGGELSEPDKFYDLVMERERKSSTVANGGVAFPHARTNLVDQLLLGIGRSEAGIAFADRSDPVHLLFVIAVPQQMVNDYLICVGALARLLKSAERRQALLGATTPSEFFDELQRDD